MTAYLIPLSYWCFESGAVQALPAGPSHNAIGLVIPACSLIRGVLDGDGDVGGPPSAGSSSSLVMNITENGGWQFINMH